MADEQTPAVSALEKLNPRHRRFVEEYLVHRNATEAYVRAGYRGTRETARRNAYVLLTKTDVDDAVKQAEQEALERIRLRQYEAHGQLRAVVLSDVTDYKVDDAGNVTLTPEASQLATKAISSVTRRTTTRKTKDGEEITTHDVKLTLWNKLEAIKIAGQADGWLKPEKEQSAEGQQTNNYFLSLIQIAQQRGITSMRGAEKFSDESTDSDIVIEALPHGHTGNGHNGNGRA